MFTSYSHNGYWVIGRRTVFIVAGLISGVSFEGHAQQQESSLLARRMMQDMSSRRAEMPGRPSTLSDSVRRVQRTTNGRILGAESVPFEGRDINRVKYVDERGRVKYMDDDPAAASQRRPIPTAPIEDDNPKP